MTLDEAVALRAADPDEYVRRAVASIVVHVEAMVALQKAGANVFDYGNNIRGVAKEAGYAEAFAFEGFVPLYMRPLFCRGNGPFRWAALSGDPADIARHRRRPARGLPRQRDGHALAPHGRREGPLPGPALPHLLARVRRARQGRPDLQRPRAQRQGQGADRDRPRPPRLGLGREPYRETESMRDGSDAIADWPILNALLNTAAGASWVSFHHGGGVGIGKSLHAGMVVVADGTDMMAERLRRVLTTDPGTGVMRHADAGYPEAIEKARESGIDLPMVDI